MNAVSLSAGAYLLAAVCASAFAYLVRRRWPSLFGPVLFCFALGVITGVVVALTMLMSPGPGVLTQLIMIPAIGPLLLIAQAGDIDPIAFLLLVPLMAAIEIALVAIAVTLLARWLQARSREVSAA